MKLTDRLMAFTGQPPRRRPRGWNERIGILRRREISTWLPREAWIGMLNSWRPQVITGYVMTLRVLCEHLQHRRLDFEPHILFHTSALLDSPSRTLFAESLGCRVVDLYGSEECGCIGWECRECSEYHINADIVIVEILRDGKPAAPGEAGDVIVTNLFSRAMPLIRYRLGDTAVFSNRAAVCGRPFGLMAEIQGRQEEFLVGASGRRFPPHPFYHCIDPVPGVRRWRIVQEKAGSARLEMEMAQSFTDERARAITTSLRELAGAEIIFTVVEVDQIPVEPLFKFRTIRSKAPGAGW